MLIEDLLAEGSLSATIDRLTSELKSNPSDVSRRTTLFELLCFVGDPTRAERQLDVLSHLDESPTATLGLQLYRSLLEADRQRALVFEKAARPRFMLEAPEEVRLCLEALDHSRLGRPEEARAALDRAEKVREPRSGTLDDRAIDDFRDADDILSPVLEVYTQAGYFWVPWGHLQFVEVSPPQWLRDLLWTPAKIALFDGQLGEVHLPSLYPGTHRHEDDRVKLGRMTDWREEAGEIVRGAGRKLMLAGDDVVTLLELRNLRFVPPVQENA